MNNLLDGGVGQGVGRGGRDVDLLRLMSMSKDVELWQVVHFMIRDRLFDNVHALHLRVYIGNNNSKASFNV